MHYRKNLNLQKFFTNQNTPKSRQNRLLKNKQIFIQVKTSIFRPILIEKENKKYFSAVFHGLHVKNPHRILSNSEKYFSNFYLGEY